MVTRHTMGRTSVLAVAAAALAAVASAQPYAQITNLPVRRRSLAMGGHGWCWVVLRRE